MHCPLDGYLQIDAVLAHAEPVVAEFQGFVGLAGLRTVVLAGFEALRLQTPVLADDLLAGDTEGMVAEIEDDFGVDEEDNFGAAGAVDTAAVAVAGSQPAGANAEGMELADYPEKAIDPGVWKFERGFAAGFGAASL